MKKGTIIAIVIGLIVLGVVWCNCSRFYPTRLFMKHDCIVPLNKYPELNILQENKNIIVEDLKKILEEKWINYESIHTDPLDYFRKVEEKDVFKKFEQLESFLNNDPKKPSWKAYVLIFNHKKTKYSKGLINTMKILDKIPGIKHAGFSCFEPGAISNYHRDDNMDTYRYHLPLIIPKGDCKLKIYDQLYNFDKPMIFDDSCKHQVWNKTKFNRIIMIIDVYRK